MFERNYLRETCLKVGPLTAFQNPFQMPITYTDSVPAPIPTNTALYWPSTTKHQLVPPYNDQYHLVMHSWANWILFSAIFGLWLLYVSCSKFNQMKIKQKKLVTHILELTTWTQGWAAIPKFMESIFHPLPKPWVWVFSFPSCTRISGME